MPRLLRLACAAAVLVGCSRTEGASGTAGRSSEPDAAPSAAPTRSAAESPSARLAAHPTPVPPAEAKRSHVVRFADAPELAGAADLLERHFGAAAKNGFDVQSADLPIGGRRALVVAAAKVPLPEAKPIVVVTDDRGVPAWSKDHPVAGILPPVSAVAIAAGPRGRVALAVCDPPTKVVALRLWDDDGSPFADFQVLEVDQCEDVSLLYWPRHGWVVVAVAVGTTKARLVTDNGSLRWGSGLDLGVRSRAGAIAPASLAPDTDETFVLVQAAPPDGADATRHALAFRYDLSGAPIWSRATDLGIVAPAPGERIALSRLMPAGIRATLPQARAVEITPSGAVSPAK